jgi:hypothetical protein
MIVYLFACANDVVLLLACAVRHNILVENETYTATTRPGGTECVDGNRFTVSTDILFSTNMLSLTGLIVYFRLLKTIISCLFVAVP